MVKKDSSDDRFFEPFPYPFHQIQLRTVRKQEDELKSFLVFFEKRLNQLSLVNPCIIQYHYDFSSRVLPQNPLQKTEEGRCIIYSFFCADVLPGFIIQGTNQFDSFVLAKTRDFPLVIAEKPSTTDHLVIRDHRFVLEQDMMGGAIQ